ncbi:hypothetical protein [Sphingomonas sp.]|jgi:hypothetical protein|uniref:hypothetical protein n=1 Tax=Sphingomonas sp. TaxID=28214 RepID=UPI00356927E4
MTSAISTVLMAGGLDLVEPYLTIPKGKLIDALNYECRPRGGYRRINGYTLYDGSDTAAAVAGEGVVRGVWVYNGDIYAFRDQTSVGGMFKAGVTGWVQQTFNPVLHYNTGTRIFAEGTTVTGVTSTATGVIRRVVYSTGLTDQGNVTGLLVLSGVTGTFQAAENLQVGGVTYAKAVAAQATYTLPKGGSYRFRNHNFYGQADTKRMYGVNGVGVAFEWDGTYFVPIEDGSGAVYPTQLEIHKSSLHLMYDKGSDIVSAVGNPLSFNVLEGATEIAVGDTIESTKAMTGGTLAIGCRDSIQVLYGDDADTYQIQQYAARGIRADTMREISGLTMFLDDNGLESVQAAASYGDFSGNTISSSVNPRLIRDNTYAGDAVAVACRTKGQYRIFFGQVGWYFCFEGTKFVGATPVTYNNSVLCACSGEDDNDKEVLFFGSSDGNVFKMDDGYNFNGTAITAYLKFPFNSESNPTQRKHFRDMRTYVEVEGAQPILNYRADFDFNLGVSQSSDIIPLMTQGANGSAWDEGFWDTFYFADETPNEAYARIDGTGQNLSITIYSAGTEAGTHTIYSNIFRYSFRRQMR